jgi:2-polyprenyl-6-hydroxyphenyl methylase/3-demethylubiquinone-9 3-methyltransferase
MNGTADRRNVDPAEIARFDRLAARWWDPTGESQALHVLNALRFAWIAERATLRGARALDVGCGGGLLSESLARAGADVVGVDLAPGLLDVARLHLYESGLKVDYREIGAEALADAEPATFDVVTCMEMLEHVPDPASVIAACARLLKPGGRLFVSTINRTPAAFALAIVGAEHVLRLLPRGTHRYELFVKPSELGADVRAAGLALDELAGMRYDPFAKRATLTKRVAVNYLAAATKPT